MAFQQSQHHSGSWGIILGMTAGSGLLCYCCWGLLMYIVGVFLMFVF